MHKYLSNSILETLIKKYKIDQLASRHGNDEEEEGPEGNPLEALAQMEEQNKLENRGVIFMTGMITNEGLAYVTRKLLGLHFDQNFTDDIQIIINSGGGYVDAGWAFVDLMSFIDNRIVTVAMGEVASMAASIFMAGDYRIMAQNSTAMIHHFSCVAAGNYRDLVAQRKSEDMEYQRLVKHLIKCSKYSTEAQVRKHLLLDADNYLSPQEMKAHGLCEQIYRPRKITRKGVEKRLGRK